MSLNAHRPRVGDLWLNALSQFIIYLFIQCADPGKEFMSGGGGGGGGGFQARQTAWTFFSVFFSPHSNLFYSLQRGSNGFITEEN